MYNCGVKVAGDEHLDMLGGPEWGQREATPPRDAPLPSFGFTQEQVACVCEVSAPGFQSFCLWHSLILFVFNLDDKCFFL